MCWALWWVLGTRWQTIQVWSLPHGLTVWWGYRHASLLHKQIIRNHDLL